MPPLPQQPDDPAGGGGLASWTGSAHNSWLALVLVIVIGHGAVMNLVLRSSAAAYLNAAHLVALFVLELFSLVRVSVDPRELCIRYGHLGWVRQRIALGRVEAASDFRLEPMQHGGFGYRGSLRFSGRAALVVRAGPALGIELDGGKRLSISVDDAERGARVINRLLAQRIPVRAGARASARG